MHPVTVRSRSHAFVLEIVLSENLSRSVISHARTSSNDFATAHGLLRLGVRCIQSSPSSPRLWYLIVTASRSGRARRLSYTTRYDATKADARFAPYNTVSGETLVTMCNAICTHALLMYTSAASYHSLTCNIVIIYVFTYLHRSQKI